MKVKELIDWLSENYAPDDAIVALWWDQDSFSAAHDMEKEEWADVAQYLEAGDWWQTKEALDYAMAEYTED